MIDNRVFLVLVIGIASLVVIGADVVSNSLQNNYNNKIHDQNLVENIESHNFMKEQNELLHTGSIADQHTNITKELHEVYSVINKILNSTGGVDSHIEREQNHFRLSSSNAETLKDLINNVNNTIVTLNEFKSSVDSERLSEAVNTSLTYEKKLNQILMLLNNTNNSSSVCPPGLNVGNNTRCLLVD